ncbi:MAG: aminotransferase class I/II-fold pyridoxal phosphate-dependent enzyme [Candidatus Andersenbacteria bacterium]
MKTPILTSLSPNAERDDVWLAWQTMLSPWRWNRQDTLLGIEKQLSSVLNGQTVTLTSSGRSAFEAVLKALAVGEGDEVIVQAFTCVAVPAPIMWVGARPVYADIDPNTLNLDVADVERKITPKTKAIVVQHTFGIPANIERLRQLAEQHNLTLIEDCAHALGGSYQGQPLGTLGDVAILSFGRDKVISSVFGGAVTGKNAELVKKIAQYEADKPLPPRWWVAQQLRHPILMALVKPLYFRGQLGKAVLVIAQKMRLTSMAVTSDEKLGRAPDHIAWRFSPALGVLLNQQLSKLSRYTKERQATTQTYKNAVTSRFSIPAGSALLRFPYVAATPAEFFLEAQRQQILLGDWYALPVVPVKDLTLVHYVSGSCPQAEMISRQMINLPTYPGLTQEQRDRVISLAQPSAL